MAPSFSPNYLESRDSRVAMEREKYGLPGEARGLIPYSVPGYTIDPGGVDPPSHILDGTISDAKIIDLGIAKIKAGSLALSLGITISADGSSDPTNGILISENLFSMRNGGAERVRFDGTTGAGWLGGPDKFWWTAAGEVYLQSVTIQDAGDWRTKMDATGLSVKCTNSSPGNAERVKFLDENGVEVGSLSAYYLGNNLWLLAQPGAGIVIRAGGATGFGNVHLSTAPASANRVLVTDGRAETLSDSKNVPIIITGRNYVDVNDGGATGAVDATPWSWAASAPDVVMAISESSYYTVSQSSKSSAGATFSVRRVEGTAVGVETVWVQWAAIWVS